ncbi:MAG: flagellar hook protein FlgE [Acidobacteriaceae bacterium]
MASFSIPLTGLNADQTELNTIANNISNLGTTGFKAQTTSFEDLFYQQVGSSGSGDPVQAGQGVQVAANSTDFTAGSIDATAGSPSDVALTGNGFFVVNNNGTQEYTRAGDFQTDQNGNLTTTDGLQVMGYPASNGVVNTNAPLTAMQIPLGETEQANPTTQISLGVNLDASAAPGTVVPSQITVYDSLGQSHIATVDFTQSTTPLTGANAVYAAGPPSTYTYTAGAASDLITSPSNSITLGTTPATSVAVPAAGETLTQMAASINGASVPGVTAAVNGTGTALTITGAAANPLSATVPALTQVNSNTWNYSIALPPGDYTGATANTTGTLTFNGNGQLTSPAANVTGISFAGLTDGASNLTFNWNLYDANNDPTITQSASASTTGSTSQNGYASGTYQGFSIGSDGTISVQFSNGQTQSVGQLAVAMVNNEQGLSRTGDNNFAATLASGQATVGVAGTGGRGTMEGGALEESNVNISNEFSNLIVAQSAYEANAKSVTTFDTVTQAVIDMIPQA